MTEVFVTIEADNSKAIASFEELEKYVKEMYDLIGRGKRDLVNEEAFEEAKKKWLDIKNVAKQSLEETDEAVKNSGNSIDETGKQFKKTGDDIGVGMRLGTSAVKELAKSSEVASEVVSKGNKLASLAMGKRISLEAEFTKLLGKSKTASMLYAGAQSVIAWATGGATLATNAFRIALIGTGIGAVIVAIGALVVNWDRLTGAIRDSEGQLTSFGKYLLYILGPLGWLFIALDKSAQAIGGWGAAWAGVKSQVKDMLVAIGDVVESVAKLDFKETFKLFFTAGARSRKAFIDGANQFNEEAEEAAYKESLALAIKEKERWLTIQKARGEETIELERQILESRLGLYEKDSEEWKDASTALRAFNAKVAKDDQDEKDKQAATNQERIDKEIADRQAAEQRAREQRIAEERREQERKKQIRDEFAEIFRTMEMTDVERQLDTIEQKRLAFEQAGVGEVELKAWVEAQKKIVQDQVDAQAEEAEAEKKAKQDAADQELLTLTREKAELALVDARAKAEQELQWQYEDDLRKAQQFANSEEQIAIIEANYQTKRDQIKETFDRADMERQVMIQSAKMQLASQGLGAIAGLMKKNSKAAKGIAVAQATMDTYQAAWGIFKNATLNPTSILFPAQPYIQAGLAIGAGLKNIKNILAVNPEGSSSASGGGVQFSPPSSTGSGGGTSGIDFSFLGQGGQSTSSGFESLEAPDDEGKKGIKAFVVSSDITTQQAIDQKIDEQASLVGG